MIICPTALMLHIALITVALPAADLIADLPGMYQADVAHALEQAGENRTELLAAIEQLQADCPEEIAFLIANMPVGDLRTLSADFLVENVRLARQAKEETPWGRQLDNGMFLNEVLPYANLNERRDNWRADFHERFLPVVSDCQTASEATLKLNRAVFEMLKVQYHATRRPKPDQSPYESIEAGYASCTGLSILLVDACRAVGIPARVAGVPLWTTARGNHTWVEIWDGEWKFIGASEQGPFNQTWFVGRARQADDRRAATRIYAASFRKTGLHFPLVWARENLTVPAVNVTARYTEQEKAQIAGTRRLTILSTNDRHSSLLGEPYRLYDPRTTGDGTQGGMARLKTLVDQIRDENPDTLLFDAGDFMDGTIFAVAQGGAADLNLMRQVGYDAACLGNHEFTYGPEGLARWITNAPEPRLPLLCANLGFSQQHADDGLEALWGAADEPGRAVHPWILLTTPGRIRVAAFGLIGERVFVPESWPVRFEIDYRRIQRLVNRLRQEQQADVVVLVTHAGVHQEADGTLSGEVAEIARHVEGIDVIVAGHSHTRIQAQVAASEAPGSPWRTTVIEAGDGARLLGKVTLTLDAANRAIPDSVETALLPINDQIPGDPGIIALTGRLIADIEQNYLPLFPRIADKGVFGEIARAPFPLDQWNGAYLVTDAMRRAAGTDFAFTSLGGDEVGLDTNGDEKVVRVYDAFRAIRRGMGSDGRIGPPIYRYYFRLQEAMLILEATSAYQGQLDRDHLLIPSGVRMEFDSGQPPFQRIRRLVRLDAEGKDREALYDDASLAPGAWQQNAGWQSGLTGESLISVATSRLLIYGLRDLNRTLMEMGVLQQPILPREPDGQALDWKEPEELENFLCRSEDGKEIRAWYTVAEMLLDEGGVIPARYDSRNEQTSSQKRIWDVARQTE